MSFWKELERTLKAVVPRKIKDRFKPPEELKEPVKRLERQIKQAIRSFTDSPEILMWLIGQIDKLLDAAEDMKGGNDESTG